MRRARVRAPGVHTLRVCDAMLPEKQICDEKSGRERGTDSPFCMVVPLFHSLLCNVLRSLLFIVLLFKPLCLHVPS